MQDEIFKATTTQKKQLITRKKDSLQDQVKPDSTGLSLLKTSGWLLVLLLIPQLFIGLFLGIYYGVVNGSGGAQDNMDMWFNSIPILLIISLLSPMITLPLLSWATPVKTIRDKINFWALTDLNKKLLLKWLVVGIVFWLVVTAISELFSFPVDGFMVELETALTSSSIIALTVVTICLLVPIIEELIFRGWLFTRIATTKLGNIGAVTITSLIFTVIHSQYQHLTTFAVIFSLGLLLAIARHKTNNTSYCIAIHIIFNSLSILSLLTFSTAS
ncbi:CPBP family intramembrane metalloprotease [Endozoicomonas sp. G2_1]|uniref:CPBP family intramembrane glutamic endopeptidase n=1 Tax=Endozoicomonas sp. G2_1 TaxID=2821091 RepID=UPI001ADD0699|nr:CPBP family intramembrane glutamic endopeptidase [Endozoicomonas sp. G2_1]MBO9492307.1 CPBP family intramembrane metalloprotease [Endozoicomonas sp. G2_1]